MTGEINPPEDIPAVSAEDLVDGEVRSDLPEEPRRYPSTIGGLIYLVLLAITLVALLIIIYGSWRYGVQLVSLCLVVAAGARLILQEQDAGMLAVRHKYLDAAVLTGVASVLFFLALTIPNQPV